MAQLKAGTTIGGYEPILKNLLTANTIIVAHVSGTPVVLTVAEGRLVGRKVGGSIADLTGQEAADMVSAYLKAPVVPQTVASAFTDAHGFPDFLWNGQEDFAPVKVPTTDAICDSYTGAQYPYLAFDGSGSTYWQCNTAAVVGTSYLGVKNLKRNVKAIKYLNYSGVNYGVTSVKIDYSTDGGVTWTNIQTTTVVNTASAWNEFIVATYAAGDAGLHAIRILANSTSAAGWVIASCILLYNSNLDVCTTGNAVKYDENGGLPATNAFENVEGVYYQANTNMSTGNHYLGQSGLASAVKAVRMRNNNTANSPKEVRLSWKQNVGDSWTDLATVANDAVVLGWVTFSVPSYSPSGSHYFALRPTTNCAAAVWQVFEMEFYCGDDTDISMTASATDPLQLVHSSGQTNYLTEVTTPDTTLLGASMVPGKTHFIYADRNPSTGAITYGAKPVVPQYGQEFDNDKHSLLHFDAATLSDEFGHVWTAVGNGAYSASSPKFGAGKWAGTTGSCRNTTLQWNNGQPFTMEWWWYCNATTAGTIIGMSTGAVSYPFAFNLASSTTMNLYLSSNGSGWDIAAGLTLPCPTISTGTFYKIIIEWDGYYYRIWVGTSTATMTLIANVKSSIPIYTGSTYGIELNSYNNGTNPISGGIDEFRLTIGSNRYGWSPVAESAAFDKYDSDMSYFDIQKMKMYYGGGTSWTEVQRLFLGEAYMDCHGVTDMRNYALKGKYESAWFPVAVNTTYTTSHNIGHDSYVIGNILFKQTHIPMFVCDYFVATNAYCWYHTPPSVSVYNRRVATKITTAANYVIQTAIASGFYKMFIRRGW